MRKVIIALCATIALASATRSAAAQEYKMIVNSASGVADISLDQANKIFLKQSEKFANGTAASPVYQSKASAVRIAFDKAVLGKSVAAVETYWQQQIFSGKDVPPPSKGSDDDVIAFVKATPGGIGYVSASAAVAGVKVVTVK
jgi:ABC-type phosphate transport system substrate-binding protein